MNLGLGEVADGSEPKPAGAGRGDDVAARIHGILQEDPLQAPALFNLGALRHNAGRLDEAARLFRRAVISDPSFTTAYAHLTRAIGRRIGPSAGLRHGRRLRCLAPGSPQAHALLCLYNYESERLPNAIKAGERSACLDPRAEGVYRLMGLGAARLQRTDKAASPLAWACVLRPDWADVHLALAGARFSEQAYARAHDAAERAEGLGADAAECAFWRGRAAFALDRHAEADRLFARCIAIDPKRKHATEMVRLTMRPADFPDTLDGETGRTS